MSASPDPVPLSSAFESDHSGPADLTSARPSMEQVFGDVRGAMTSASKREPYPWLAVASLGFTAAWLLWPEAGAMGAVRLKLWTLFVLTSVSMVFMPMIRHTFRLDEFRAWQMAVAGAGGIGFAWVAFLLPSIGSNQAFFGTFAAASAALAAWTAPGRPA